MFHSISFDEFPRVFWEVDEAVFVAFSVVSVFALFLLLLFCSRRVE